MSKPKRTAPPVDQAEVNTQEAPPVDQAEAVAPEVAIVQPEPIAPATPEPVEPLSDYIARVERKHIERDVVAVSIAHPEVMSERVHPGTYGGIRLSQGEQGVTYSDGSKA